MKNPLDIIDKSWNPIIPLLKEEPLKSLKDKVLPYISYQPLRENIFKVFQMPVNEVKVVILGQCPYHTPNTAIGKSFAVGKDTKIPPSLRVILCELLEGKHLPIIPNTVKSEWKTLNHWSEQGVFLLNTALTVKTGEAGSHLNYWEKFTKFVISYISETNPCLWLLWGAKAHKFIPYIKGQTTRVVSSEGRTVVNYIIDAPIEGKNDCNYILTASHPAAEIYNNGGAGFYGCNHFSLVNEILISKKLTPIKW